MQKAICQHPIDKKTKIFSEFCIILQILAQNNSVHKKNVNKIKEVIISCYGLTLKTITSYFLCHFISNRNRRTDRLCYRLTNPRLKFNIA